MDEIDKFRNSVLDKIIETETLKEQKEKAKQRMCHHSYDLIGNIYSKRYQHRQCSKCGHSAMKRIEVWEGTKTCIIA
jgi:peptide subunit release factor 1 (eRF1)